MNLNTYTKGVTFRLWFIILISSIFPLLALSFLLFDSNTYYKLAIGGKMLFGSALILSFLGWIYSIKIFHSLGILAKQIIELAEQNSMEAFEPNAMKDELVALEKAINILNNKFWYDVNEFHKHTEYMRNINLRIDENISLLKTIHNIRKELISKENLQEVFSAIMSRISDILKVRKSYLIIFEEIGPRFFTNFNENQTLGKLKQFWENEDNWEKWQQILLNNELINLNNGSKLDKILLETNNILNIDKGLIIPLNCEKKLLGVLIIDKRLNEIPFNTGDYPSVMAFADLIILSYETARLNALLETIAATDTLTGMHTFSVFNQELEQEIARAKRYERPLCIVLFKLEGLAKFRNLIGEKNSEELLKAIADIIPHIIRQMDNSARYGNNGFALLLPDINIENVNIILERLERKLKKVLNELIPSDIKITPIIVYAIFPNEGETSKKLLETAQEKLIKRIEKIADEDGVNEWLGK